MTETKSVLLTRQYSMKFGYRLVSLDISQMFDRPGVIINRLYTPPCLRGRGYARAAMERLCEDADTFGEDLYLEINPYGDLDYDQLQAFYETLGFEEIPEEEGLFRRVPQ